MIKADMEYSNDKNEIYVNTNNCNLNRSRKTLVASDDMIDDINTNKKFPSIVKELFIKCRKLKSNFPAPKDVRLNSTHYQITKICNKRKLQNIAIIIQQILITNTFWRFTENTQASYILFWLSLLNYQQVTRYVLEGISLVFYGLTLADKIKSLHDKSKAKEPHYNLDRETARIFPM